ncbi:MAG TPA: hypothetical protein VLZ83_06585 [Edaphocola sp.]|nr:hypothetical protein [Edaphocola sp.]
MKKKVIFAVATGLFALAMVFNMNVLQSNSAGDVSLESITVMAQAGGESGGGYNICYYESRVRTGYTYYNCSTCNTKIYDEKGKGSYSKCFY